MKTKKRLFKKSKPAASEISLQITSMADIFTILLVFLLKGIASDAIQITPANATTLPAGLHSVSLPENALQVEVTKNEILVEKEKIISLNDLKQNMNSEEIILSLNQRLLKEREKQKMISEQNSDIKMSNSIVLLADQSIPFSTLKLVMKTMAKNGYSEIKFAAIRE